MAVAFYNLNSDSGLKKLDEYLLTCSYITGYQASKDDITVYSSLGKLLSSEYINASRWYKHIDALLRISGVSGEGSGVKVEGSTPITEPVTTPPAADAKATAAEDEDDDDVDLFGDETEEEKNAAEERAAALKDSGKKKESKLVPVGYGIKKLKIILTVDDLESIFDLVENYLTVEPINEYVQSCHIVDFI
ncbi:PREDICTED: elongation factor 1-delta 1-like isoform X2 [Nicotiana attenuata]|uniref:elongation factor 1-delta 1-like isoform X2 n=1 Tax=Nicotiana attenuata TaxID=49451 RepID=UPI000905C5FB|nr:PREDICTED: elongation factor 1-delta 1-like isoform X2 [Nicotiana attenuata]